MLARTRPISIGLVFLCLTASLVVGFAQKSPCLTGDWNDGRHYRWLCYTDVVPLLDSEQLANGRLPYLDPCDASLPGECDEYPVLSMWVMRLAAEVSGPDEGTFFFANFVLLTLAAFVIALCLYLVVGGRALYFALAPTLVLYAFVNLDLLAVVFATAATVLFLKRRDGWSGILLGLGAAAKIYPALLLLPFVAGWLYARERDRGMRLVWAAAAAWAAVNLPFAILAPQGWWEFFRFNSARSADWDSLWFLACDSLTSGVTTCSNTRLVNVLSAFLFVLCVTVVYRWKRSREPAFVRWTLAFPLVILFLLSNKVYSPQYGLWLLPWFALALPDLRLFAAFEAADVAVFVTRFSWFGELEGYGGLPLGAFQVALLVRAVVLLICVVAWVHRREPAPVTMPMRELAPAAAAP